MPRKPKFKAIGFPMGPLSTILRLKKTRKTKGNVEPGYRLDKVFIDSPLGRNFNIRKKE